jgi:hypothetical protein
VSKFHFFARRIAMADAAKNPSTNMSPYQRTVIGPNLKRIAPGDSKIKKMPFTRQLINCSRTRKTPQFEARSFAVSPA